MTNDGRVWTGVALLGLTVLGVARGKGSRGIRHERPGQRAVAELDGLAAMGETVEEAIARLGAKLYQEEGEGDGAYARAWHRITVLLDENPEIDPEAVNAMYERMVEES